MNDTYLTLRTAKSLQIVTLVNSSGRNAAVGTVLSVRISKLALPDDVQS
jgi:hypothetical protein